jgi:hypothetical protein
LKGVSGGVERHRGRGLKGKQRGTLGGEKRTPGEKVKSLRNEVHNANGVVWEPV